MSGFARRRQGEIMRNLFLSTLMVVAVTSPATALLRDEEPSNNNVATAPIQMPIPPNEYVVSADAGVLTFRVGEIGRAHV